MFDDHESLGITQTLEQWVMEKCDAWRDHYIGNYQQKHDEYYRLWRGQWDASDRTRASERSRIIAPALQQAVESSVAEVEEATFGRGLWFDIKDDDQEQSQDIPKLRDMLRADFTKNKVRKGIAEAVLNSAIFGTGVGEVVMTTIRDMKPATQPVMGGDLTAVGVTVADRTAVKLVPVMPQNFLIDPLAHSVDEALGCAVDRFVPRHTIEQGIEEGIYRDVDLSNASDDFDIEADKQIESIYQDDKVRLIKYFGLVPRYLLEEANRDDDAEDITHLAHDEEEDSSEMVEAIVIIANEGELLKAEANPYMMQDRPIVAFAWDAVPSRFWGRGVCEKGYNSQKALDAELRARIDALALTIHPMMAMDATRMPRGAKPEIRPGKVILTNGNPAEVLQPFNFGNVSQVTFAQADALQRMVQVSTGAIDSAGIAGSINGESTAAGMSMSLGAIIKRHKRTLINFQESFIIPYVEKAAWRYMQFEPELFPVGDYSFIASSSLGVVAREYEVSQLVQLLQTMQPESPQYNLVMTSIIDNMSLTNREEILAQLAEMSKPNPQAQEAQQLAAKADNDFKASQTLALTSQAGYDDARASKATAEAQAVPVETETNRIKAMTQDLNQGEEDAREFDRRLKLGALKLKEREVALKEDVVPAAPAPMAPAAAPMGMPQLPQQPEGQL